MPLHQDLLNLASELVDRNPAAPIEADLRRGVSTAYYALFHLLIHEATTRLVTPIAIRSRVARSFDHRIMRNVCQEFAKLAPNAAAQLATATGEIVPPGIKEIASEFVALQQARAQADYETAATFTQQQAQADVQRAESAFAGWLTVQADPAADTFLAELLCRGTPSAETGPFVNPGWHLFTATISASPPASRT
jgi:hypothetical protein